MKQVLSENTTNRIKETIEIHRLNRRLLKEWKDHFMAICKDCIAKGEDDNDGIQWKCDCDVQFYLDLITGLLNGNGDEK